MAKLTMAEIVEATKSNSMVYATPASVKSMVDKGMVETNSNITNPDNDKEIAVRATEKGMNEAGEGSSNKPETETFEIETVAASEVKSQRGNSGRPDLYPFDKLGAPEGEGDSAKFQSFFVPATAKRPEPWQSLASTVSAASKRYATKTGTKEYETKDGETKERNVYEYERKFRIVASEKNGVKGARISRIK